MRGQTEPSRTFESSSRSAVFCCWRCTTRMNGLGRLCARVRTVMCSRVRLMASSFRRSGRLMRWALASLFHFDGENVGRPEHIRAEHYPLTIRRAAHIRLKAVLVFRHVDELLSVENSRLDEAVVSNSAVLDELRPEQIDPLAVGRFGHLPGGAASASEEVV